MRKKQFLVIGAGRFGSALATALYQDGHEIVVMDENEGRIEKIMDSVSHALIGDSTDEDVLRKIGVGNFDTVVVAIGSDFEAAIMTVVTAKKLGAQQVLAKAVNETAAAVLARVGADKVILPERDMGRRLATQLTTPELVDAFKLGAGHAVVEVAVSGKLLGSLADLKLPNRFSVQVIAVNRDGDVIVSPGAAFTLRRGDNVVLIGNNESIERFRDYISN